MQVDYRLCTLNGVSLGEQQAHFEFPEPPDDSRCQLQATNDQEE